MKTFARIFFLLAACISTTLAAGGGLAFSAVEQRIESGELKNRAVRGSTDAMKKGRDKWAYDVTVSNNGFEDVAGLEIRYVVFIKREELGQKRGAGRIDRTSGSTKADVIKGHSKFTFTTEPVDMNKGNLGAGWYYESGGRTKAEDKLCGIWLRAYQNGAQVAEFTRPSGLAAKQKWE
jgi:hypothetical protein